MSKEKKITYLSEEREEDNLIKKGGLKKLKQKLKECQEAKEEYLALAQRARADLVNYRRKQEQFLEELDKHGQANLIKELLPVLDSLEIGGRTDNHLSQIKEQLEKILQQEGLKKIEALDKKFNPEIHEAVEQVASKKESGTIIEEIQKGYLFREKVLRPSKVKVAE